MGVLGHTAYESRARDLDAPRCLFVEWSVTTCKLRASFLNIMSGDEFDRLPDPFSGIDWNTIPGLSVTPLPSHSGPSISGGTPAVLPPRHFTTPGANSTSASTQYSFDEIDAAFLAEVDKVERRLLQPQEAQSGGTSSKEGVSTHSGSKDEVTSRYFHGGDIHVCFLPSHLLSLGSNKGVC